MSRHTVPASEKSGRPEVDFFVVAVDRKRCRVRIEIPVYNAYFVFTKTDEGVKITSKRDRCPINPSEEYAGRLHKGVYAHMV